MTRILTCLLVMAVLTGCCGPAAFTAERVREINNQWMEMYNKDRRQTADEVDQYAKLTDEQKVEWRRAGKPSDRPLSPRILGAADDFFKAVELEIEAAGKKKEE